MFSQTQINLHNACADVLREYQKHQEKVKHCNNALNNPGMYRHYTPEEYRSMMEDSKQQMEEIVVTYAGVMRRMFNDIMNHNTTQEIEIV